MNKYQDIKKIFPIQGITQEYILINDKGNHLKVLIYKIEPIVMLGLSQTEKENIVMVYKELLRQVNFDFQIIMLNSKLNIDQYIEQLIKKMDIAKIKNISLKNKYVEDIKSKLLKENIYETDYYIAISISGNTNLDIYAIDNVIKKLERIGCATKRIYGRNKLQDLLYRGIHKQLEWGE